MEIQSVIEEFNNLSYGREVYELYSSLELELKRNREIILSAIKNSCKSGDFVSSTLEILGILEDNFKGDFEIMSAALEKAPTAVTDIYLMASDSIKKDKKFFKMAIYLMAADSVKKDKKFFKIPTSHSDDVDALIDELFKHFKGKTKESKRKSRSNYEKSRSIEVKSEGMIFTITFSYKNGKASTKVFDSEGREYQSKARSLLRLKTKELGISEDGYLEQNGTQLITHAYFNKVYKTLKG